MVSNVLNKWNAIYRHVEDGIWVMRVAAGFESKQEAQQYVSQPHAEHLNLAKQSDVAKNPQYKPW